MNINQVGRLLNEANRKTICGINLLEEFRGQSENYYKLEKNEEEWIFSFVQCEKTYPKEEVIKKFNDAKEAITFYYLYELSRSYNEKYVYLFERENRDINLGELDCTLANIKEAFNRLGIKENYYNFKNEKNEHSICLKEIGNGKSEFVFIGNNNKIIFKTMELENWDAYSSMFRCVYLLYLLDRHCEFLLKNKEIDVPFSDEEYDIFIS